MYENTMGFENNFIKNIFQRKILLLLDLVDTR